MMRAAWWSPTEVASLKRRLEEKVIPEPNSGCWLFDGSRHRDGHGCISVPGNKKLYAHRVAWQLACGPIPAGKVVCHRCDVASCVNPDHLFLGTARDNALDAVAKGRNVWGEKDGNSKLRATDILLIREAVAAGKAAGRRNWGAGKLAAQLGVSLNTVRSVASGKSWHRLCGDEGVAVHAADHARPGAQEVAEVPQVTRQ